MDIPPVDKKSFVFTNIVNTIDIMMIGYSINDLAASGGWMLSFPTVLAKVTPTCILADPCPKTTSYGSHKIVKYVIGHELTQSRQINRRLC